MSRQQTHHTKQFKLQNIYKSEIIMKTVITYGTFDLLHYGHINLLKRAKALGDFLIVGVSSDEYNRNRGKNDVQQSVTERVAAVRATGLADEVIVGEYYNQIEDDIKKYNADILVLGSDWEGKYDYLRKYCQVVYLPRTEGISSSDLRAGLLNANSSDKPDNA